MCFFPESGRCAIPTYDYKCNDCGVIEISHGMTEDNRTVCPECNEIGLVKLISAGAGIIIAGREANQYNDIKAARYWRDKNGERHPVTAADGYSTSSTVNKQTALASEVKAKTQKDRKEEKKKRMNLITARAGIKNREEAKKSTSWGEGRLVEEVEKPE